MNNQEDIVVGSYIRVEESVDVLESQVLGAPKWLCPEQTREVKCEGCGENMKQIIQIYSPLEEEHNWYRKLFILACLQPKCSQQQHIRCIRQQLPKAHPMFTQEDTLHPQHINTYQQQLDNTHPQQYILSNTTFAIHTQIVTNQQWLATYKQILKQLADNHSNTISQLHIPLIQDDSDDDDHHQINSNNNNKQDYTHENQLLEQYNQQKGDYNINYIEGQHNQQQQQHNQQEEDEDIDDCLEYKRENDEFFQVYQLTLQSVSNKEIMRFCRSASSHPLYMNKHNQFPQDNKCKHCGQSLVFEFQLHSTLLNLSPALYNLDWAILAVYTCKDSCYDSNNFTEETVFLQLNQENNIDLEAINNNNKQDNSVNKLEEMVNRLDINKKKNKNKNKNKKKEEDQQIIQNKEDQGCDWS